MPDCPALFDAHRRNLRKRGLSDERIARNGCKSMPEAREERRRVADFLSRRHDLTGIPGFYTRYGKWTIAGACGTLIPVRDKDGLIQGLKIRPDDEANPGRKYRWLSSRDRHMENGTRSCSWIHVTGDRTRKRAFLTEGPLKSDVASFLANDALFICTGGVNATRRLRETIEAPGVTEVAEAMDMDQTTNPQVLRAVPDMRREVMTIPGIRYLSIRLESAAQGSGRLLPAPHFRYEIKEAIMDEQMKRTMLKISVSDDFLIFRTFSRRKKSPHLYARRDELCPLLDGKRVVLNDEPYFCVITPIDRDSMMSMDFTWISPTSGSSICGWQQTLKIPRERFLDFLEKCKAEERPPEWKALSMDAPRFPRLIFRQSRSLRQVMNNQRVRRKLTKFLRGNFRWQNTDEVVFFGDFVPHSFFFREYRRGKNGMEAGMCGGVILHSQEDMKTAYYSIHT